MFTKEDINQLQIAIIQRISRLEKSLITLEPGDAGYDTLHSGLVQSKLVYEKLIRM